MKANSKFNRMVPSTIIGVHRSDAGMYTCIADNGVGSSALKQIQFEVKGRMNKPTLFYIIILNNLLILTSPGLIYLKML